MYIATQAQLEAEKRLNKQGFRFSNWIPHLPNAENEPSAGTEHLGSMVMIKRTHRFFRQYREIEPSGIIN